MRDLLVQGEDLALKITELQTEYEHYREYADTKIMELEDQVERLNAQNESKEELLNKIQGQKFVIQDYDDEIKRMKKAWEKERHSMQTQIMSLENHLQAKDLIFKDLEQHNEELRTRLELAGFSAFDKIKRQIFASSLQQRLKEISPEKRSVVDEVIKECEQMEQKYLNHEQRIQKLQEENAKLATRISQMEFFGLNDQQLVP